jgi:hypothetical protein
MPVVRNSRQCCEPPPLNAKMAASTPITIEPVTLMVNVAIGKPMPGNRRAVRRFIPWRSMAPDPPAQEDEQIAHGLPRGFEPASIEPKATRACLVAFSAANR